MGVPKFFRYISERYPCLSEFVKEYQIPTFDNLYLDMNGIIHMCSHPDDGNPHFRITEEKIFADIFHYIEVLFRMIKPQKVFFMAVDGVAPRAKMNQQRGRRFRSAKEAEKAEKEALRKGEELPDTERFDSNCITPGTEFMARLDEQLKYFVVNKISTDRMWKKCQIILSGHKTPGEGEHKIMDYIRYIRSQSGYDPNTRHCLYGLDADLIMLGLCTHEPHFSLLREEVKFGKKAKRTNVPEEIRFYLLHLSLMREYLELEFGSLKEQLKNSNELKFDIEKVIDDWILMGFLVGNDFIPNLPNLHIANGALPVLYKAYMEVLPTLDGYINEEGTLHLERFEKFMKKLADIDVKNFEEISDDLQYMKMKTGRKHPAHISVSSKPNKNEDDATDCHDEISKQMDPDLAKLIQDTDALDIDSEDESDGMSSSNEDEAFKSFKDEYYRNKMEYRKVTREVMREQAEGYVRAIQWNLNYYYNGVCSWSWFYPHHYSPYISDIKGFSDLKIEFELGAPFKPYEQLLAVLPPASKNLLPKCYHHLMTDENSIIKAYYPEEFQTDLNGKRQEWEAVVLVPFIDENILLEAMKPCNERLSLDEIRRNTHGPMLICDYVEECLGIYKAPNYFPNVENHARCKPVNVEDIRVPKETLIKGAYPGARFDVYYPGFPTMKHLKYESRLKKANVKVFEVPSRNENMMLRILPNELYFEDSIPVDLLGRNVWVAWPHLVEAKIVAISNRKLKYTLSNEDDKKYTVEERTGNASSLFNSELDGVTKHYRERMGIEFGETKVLVHVKMITGHKYVFTSSRSVNLEKQFSPVISHFPLQSIVCDINVLDECHSNFSDISDVFPVGSSCFSLTNPFYGSQGIVIEENQESAKSSYLKVSLTVAEEPDLTLAQIINDKLKKNCLSLTNSASQLTISNNIFSRITGSLFISTSNSEKLTNIGLNLKFNKKNLETPGYTKKLDNVWYYTNKAVALVRKYVEKFPEVFDYLSRNNSEELIADHIFGENKSEEKLKSIKNWLKTLPTHNIERRICDSSVLEADVIAEIERIVDQTKISEKNIVMQIKPQLLYKPEIQMGNLTPDPLVKIRVFDRIVNVREGFTVPLGLKGTVTAVHKSADNLSDEMYDIVFDGAFAGGMALNCSEQRGYRLPKTSFINLSHGKRQMEQKTGVPGVLRALAKERQTTSSLQASKSTNVNERQQNSAFASFNKFQFNNHNPPFGSQNKSNSQYNQINYQFRSQQHLNTASDQNKINKNSFYYMADYSSRYEPKASKENGMNQKNREVRNNSKYTSTGASFNVPRELSNSKPRTEVDTDFLRKILKIEDTPDASRKLRSRAPPSSTKSEQNQPGTSQKKESSTASASAQLLSYYQSNCLGCPRYTYLSNLDGFAAQILLPDGQVLYGKNAKSREEASENVALEALIVLKNLPSKSPRQAPPSDFPVPPTKWVQQQISVPSQVFVNNSYQFKQTGQHQRLAITSTEYNRKGSAITQGNVQHNSGESTNVNTTSFIPLQALKKKQVNKSLNNPNKDVNEGESSSRQLTYQANNYAMTSAEKEPQGNLPKERSGKRRPNRKTRIAANFYSK